MPEKFYNAILNEEDIKSIEEKGNLERFVADISSAYLGKDFLRNMDSGLFIL